MRFYAYKYLLFVFSLFEHKKNKKITEVHLLENTLIENVYAYHFLCLFFLSIRFVYSGPFFLRLLGTKSHLFIRITSDTNQKRAFIVQTDYIILIVLFNLLYLYKASKIYYFGIVGSEMSIAADSLPLPRRTLKKTCRRRTAAAMGFRKMF
jgi:hypothetical protein